MRIYIYIYKYETQTTTGDKHNEIRISNIHGDPHTSTNHPNPMSLDTHNPLAKL